MPGAEHTFCTQCRVDHQCDLAFASCNQASDQDRLKASDHYIYVINSARNHKFAILYGHAAATADLLSLLQKGLWVFLLVVAHIDVPDSPGAIFGSCDHLGGIWGKRQAEYLALVTLNIHSRMNIG